MSASLLQVAGLQKSYNAPVLVDFNFALRPGEVHALIGSNGAGKSTFARILCGLTAGDGGEMRFCGQAYRPKSKREAERAGVVMVLQELNVIGALSIAENIFSTDCRGVAAGCVSRNCGKRQSKPWRVLG